jgi:nucleoside-diphosphate-sugar epimerase
MAEDLVDYPLILVTGAAGWLGRRVARALSEGMAELGEVGAGGRRVRCLIRPDESPRELQDLGIQVIAGDLRDPEAREAFTQGAEGALVLHLAGVIHPPGGRTRSFDEVNHRATLALLEAAGRAGVRRFVAMSSNSPLGGNPDPEHRFTEDSPYRPYMGYGRSKMRMEQGLRAAMGRAHTPEIVIARAPWFYGPGQPPRQTLFFKMIRDGKFPLLGRGLNRRSMAYVDSLALGLLLAAGVPGAAGRTYWLADDRPYTMAEIVDTVRDVLRDDFGLEVKDSTLTLPSPLADVARLADGLLQSVGLYHQKIHVLSEMNMTIACDISRAKEELGYRPLVALREGMGRSIAWCLDQGLEI